jgi:hypothetical protein
MEPEEIAELRTTYVFTPPDGRSWGLTNDRLAAVLRQRDPDEFIRVEEGTDGPVRGSSTHFGITLDDEELEGMALLSPEGVSVNDRTVRSAAAFALWLTDSVVPAGPTVMFNTEWGIEAELPDTPVPDATRPRIAAALGTPGGDMRPRLICSIMSIELRTIGTSKVRCAVVHPSVMVPTHETPCGAGVRAVRAALGATRLHPGHAPSRRWGVLNGMACPLRTIMPCRVLGRRCGRPSMRVAGGFQPPGENDDALGTAHVGHQSGAPPLQQIT